MKWKALGYAGLLMTWAAATPSGAASVSPWYLGLKTGWMDLDAPGADEATNLGLYGGYTLVDDVNGRFALEGEYTRSIADGEVGGRGWDIETLATYGAYRTAGPWFLKLKAGYLSEDVSAANGRIRNSETGFSFGAGGGARLGNKTAFELEYTVVEEDVNFFSIGYLTHF